jgi:hypothetical protein
LEPNVFGLEGHFGFPKELPGTFGDSGNCGTWKWSGSEYLLPEGIGGNEWNAEILTMEGGKGRR